jgi:uncharacterized membrane protein (UPF0127 family)
MSTPSTARVSLALVFGLSVLGAACDAPAKKQSAAPASGAPTAPASEPGSATCDSDDDCTRPWSPSMEGCGSLDRCYDGACIEPPATTGAVNPHTGRVAFETSAGEKSWQVEIVRSPFETQRGLMCRTSMRSDWGMLFLLESTRLQAFWMKNTLIPLDMVFITDDWTVAGVVTEVPPRTLEPRGVNAPSRYVLELASGEAKRAGIAAGTKVRYYAPRGE